MKDLNFQLRQLCDRNRDGSYSTQNKRTRTLQHCATLLHEAGFRKMNAQSLKPKHVLALVERFKHDGLSAGSIKNNMAALRWWAEKVGKASVIARDNDYYGIDRRVFVTGSDKGQALDLRKLDAIKDDYVRASLRLQAAFGLRREESIKFQPSFAMQDLKDGFIRLKDSWTKGGKERIIPLSPELKEVQLSALKNAASIAGKGSLIPPQKKYVEQLRAYERHTRNAGLSKLHGLRHQYAQDRYKHLTGWECPAKGGAAPKTLDPLQRKIDDMVRRMISKELGHERKQIVAIYLGG